MIRIAVDATAVTRQWAGVGRFARGLLSGLAQIDTRNEYLLLAAGAARVPLDDLALPRHRWRHLPVSERLTTILWQRLRVPAWPMLRECPSLFFTPDYALPRLGALPGIPTVHDLSFMIHPECADDSLRRYLNMVVPRSVAEASAVFAVSETTARSVADLLGVPLARICVVPNGVDRQFRPWDGAPAALAERLRSRFDLAPGYLLSVGTLEPRKNYPRLLQAYDLARRALARELPPTPDGTRPPPTLVIAGREGWMYEPIFREVARLNLGRQVRFLTRLGDGDLIDLYRGAGAFVYPSIYEGFGIPPLEAMACGVPVASSTGGALPEVLGDAALLFPPTDVGAMAGAIRRILLDDELRPRLVARGLIQSAHYTWEGAARVALARFEQVAA